ncbi:hypothetical protein GQ457_09G023400 [Hibiscus cannabinus]
MVETKRSRDQSRVMNEFIIEENLESYDSEYMPSEHENLEFDFLDSENDHCDASDEICDGPVHGSVEKSLGSVPHNTSVVSSDSGDDVESLHSASSDNIDSRREKKSYYQGYLLAAVGIDANDCIYPIAVAAVKAETRDSWCWFLQLLAEDLDIVNSHHLTLMSDKQKGLIEVVLELFPHAEKRNCVRNMYSNFKNDEGFKGKPLKDSLWKTARATTVRDYEKEMAEMKGISIDSYNWLKAKDPSTWSKSHSSTRSKCDILLNNYSECFNKMILEARDKPILTMMEIIRTQMMHRISKKAETAHKCWPSHAGDERYEVAFGPFDQHVVNLQTRDCSCRKWGLTGIPCAHAVSVLPLEQHKPEEYVDECYHTSTQIAIYSNLIYPIRGANQWEQIPAMEPILPPLFKGGCLVDLKNKGRKLLMNKIVALLGDKGHWKLSVKNVGNQAIM